MGEPVLTPDERAALASMVAVYRQLHRRRINADYRKRKGRE